MQNDSPLNQRCLPLGTTFGAILQCFVLCFYTITHYKGGSFRLSSLTSLGSKRKDIEIHAPFVYVWSSEIDGASILSLFCLTLTRGVQQSNIILFRACMTSGKPLTSVLDLSIVSKQPRRSVLCADRCPAYSGDHRFAVCIFLTWCCCR